MLQCNAYFVEVSPVGSSPATAICVGVVAARPGTVAMSFLLRLLLLLDHQRRIALLVLGWSTEKSNLCSIVVAAEVSVTTAELGKYKLNGAPQWWQGSLSCGCER